MRRLLAAAGLLLASCSTGTPAVGGSPPPEIAVLGLAGGGHAIVRTQDGRLLASLPAGFFEIGLSGGADIAEAYLVVPAAGQTSIRGLLPSHAYALAELATQPGPAVDAVLAPAPGLTTFVGRESVLAVLGADGRLTGYQHGARIWSVPLGLESPELRLVGSRLVVGSAGSWRLLTAATGELGPGLATGGDPCRPGPVMDSVEGLVFDCSGRLSLGGAVPEQLPVAIPGRDATTLAFPGGQLWRVQGSTAAAAGQGPAWTVPPAASPDGSVLYLATASGIESVDAATGAHHLMLAAGSITSLAVSRDGNYLYALAGGRLGTYAVAGGGQVASVRVAGEVIEQIAGG